MPRNLVICCDGTANEFAADRTNVLKLAFAAEKHDGRQLVYYHPGVGTMAPPGLFTAIGKWTARLAGMAFGYGLKADIRDIYTFIINHFEPGDRLYIFGFSRGAYTARAVAALIHGYGLLGPGNDALVPYAIRLLWSANRARTDEARNHYFKLAGEFRSTLSVADCRPSFLGLWDTVSSVGWIANPLALPYTHTLPNVETIRHAVAIDERRAFFRTNLVANDPSRDIQEVWFPGVHCDVGGGYPEAQSGLSKLSLKWMTAEARKAGMLFDDSRVDLVLGRSGHGYAPGDPNAVMHKSLTWPWWPAEFLLKKHWDKTTRQTHWRPNLFRPRHFSPSPIVDDSAWARDGGYADRLPPDAMKHSMANKPRAATGN
ncbi:DUF2235 domain-containing protein [Sphingomonas limnosediminicola]|uniref:DUF2235 domain-containing protein n=1 Tax=Sphingomonas limnosediminicola TaxID=940133 RepID=A0ABP7L612_9SPHN